MTTVAGVAELDGPARVAGLASRGSGPHSQRSELGDSKKRLTWNVSRSSATTVPTAHRA